MKLVEGAHVSLLTCVSVIVNLFLVFSSSLRPGTNFFSLLFSCIQKEMKNESVSHIGLVALPRGAMGLSAVCDCGISLSYSLTI